MKLKQLRMCVSVYIWSRYWFRSCLYT